MSQLLDRDHHQKIPKPAAKPEAENTTNPQEDSANSKSSSPRRIAASRANGAKSTGPTTAPGQAALAASPRNFKNGMLAQTVVLESKSKPRFDQLVEALIAEHYPTTKSEHSLVEMMAVAG